MSEKSHAGSTSAVALVVANMIGTGVFVSLHFQLFTYSAAIPILMLWVVGGLVALCGALSYADVARAMPRSGGEYRFLTELYHPSLGFMAGILSAVVGFAAPTALVALALGIYLHSSIPAIPVEAAAVAVILIGAFSHAMSVRTSARVQVAATTLKITLIAIFLIASIFLPGHGDIRWTAQPEDWKAMFQPAFAAALFWVFYAYTGWNAAVYGLEEWDHPRRDVKRALVGGTLIVIAIYVALNAAFLRAAPMDGLRQTEAVADVAAGALFGPAVAHWTSALLALGLFSSVSALLWAGPRVLGSMGRDMHSLRWFATPEGPPIRSLALQTGLAIFFVFYGKLLALFSSPKVGELVSSTQSKDDLEKLMKYTTVGLTLCSALTVGGLFLLWRRGKVGALSLIPATVFLIMSGFVIYQSLAMDVGWQSPDWKPSLQAWLTAPTFSGLVTAIVCALLWFPLNRKSS
ncbi:MAG: amino acid permease [Luteolibacter sp.]